MSQNQSPYVPLDEPIRSLMESLSVCRDPNCPVPKYHPQYMVPQQPPFYDGPRPCMPVVPTRLCKGNVLILGMYPTCRFANVQTADGERLEEVPVRDINEPFEDSRYFDGYGVRDVRSGTIFRQEYLLPLGLERENLWITNLVKCFLFGKKHWDNYQALGWANPPFEPTADKDYFDAARLCFAQHLAKEVELCKPKLVLALGEPAGQMIHADQDLNPSDDKLFEHLRGKPLRANIEAPGSYKRHPLFAGTNVFCFYHPTAVRESPHMRKEHRNQDIPEALKFLQELGIETSVNRDGHNGN
jgi:uracil-DNA glycosylase